MHYLAPRRRYFDFPPPLALDVVAPPFVPPVDLVVCLGGDASAPPPLAPTVVGFEAPQLNGRALPALHTLAAAKENIVARMNFFEVLTRFLSER